MPADLSTLPFIDEHAVTVAAPPAVVWARLRPGKQRPGFTVAEAVPDVRLVLTGRHWFADYTLAFVLDDLGGSTRLAARSYARFPGCRGRLYRTLVIGTGGHRVVVRTLLRGVRVRAESAA